MSFKKNAIAVNLTGFRPLLINEINRLLANPTQGLGIYLPNSSERFQSVFLTEVINLSLMRATFYSRTWKNIDAIIFQSIIDNSIFLNIEGNMYATKLPYFETVKQFHHINKYEILEDILLSEIISCFPYVSFDANERIKIQTIVEHLVNTFVYEFILNNPDVQLLINHFKDNYVEIFINKIQQDSFTILIHREMMHYIKMLADKEEEIQMSAQVYKNVTWGNPVIYNENSVFGKFAHSGRG